MPAKGSKRKYQNRKVFLKKDLWKKYCEQTGAQISWEDFKLIMQVTLKTIQKNIATNKLGVKIPVGGYISVTRYKTPTNMIDKVYLRKTGQLRPLLNLNSFGDQCRIRWWRAGLATFRFNNTYKFEAAKELKNRVRDAINEGMEYESLTTEVYMPDSMLERVINRKMKRVVYE